jgi:hypothetical protein
LNKYNYKYPEKLKKIQLNVDYCFASYLFTNGTEHMHRNQEQNTTVPSEQQVSQFETIAPIFSSTYKTMQLFARQQPDGVVTQAKILMINRLLKLTRDVLRHQPGGEFLSHLNHNARIHYTDVVLLMAQYRAIMNKFVTSHYQPSRRGIEGYWRTTEFIKETHFDEEFEEYIEEDSETRKKSQG